jgi:hypothetical protein
MICSLIIVFRFTAVSIEREGVLAYYPRNKVLKLPRYLRVAALRVRRGRFTWNPDTISN